jgi:hypothetical protein
VQYPDLSRLAVLHHGLGVPGQSTSSPASSADPHPIGSEDQLPAILLDYMYSAAAYDL